MKTNRKTLTKSINKFTINILMGIFLVAHSLSFAGTVYDEGTSKVIGKIADAETGEAVIGATIRIEGTGLGAYSDLDGNFQVKKVPFGYYTVKVSSVGYKTTELSTIVVTADQNSIVNVLISPQLVTVNDITVTAKAIQNTEAILLLKRQNANEITDAISSEEMSRSGSSDAADAMSKVTGATVVSGKYVYIRGLGDRYSNTKLNGAVLPSPDPDQQAVPMDMIPTALLDNIIVEKSFTPEKPGDFAGGSVNLSTKDYPEKRSLKFSTSSSYNSNSTFNDMLYHTASSTDWLGYDDGQRDIPKFITGNPELQNQVPEGVSYLRHSSGITDYDSVAALASYIEQANSSFNPEMSPKVKSTPLNQSYAISYGDLWSLYERPLGVVASLSYSNKYSSYNDGTAGKYKLSGLNSEELTTDYELNDSQGKEDILWSGLMTLKYGIHRNHKLGFSLIYTQNGESTTRFLTGEVPEHVDPGEFVETRTLGYKERKINVFQFSGDHLFLGDNRFHWQLSLSNSNQDEPDIRFFTNQLSPIYVEDEDTGDLVPTGEFESSIAPNRFTVPERGWRSLHEDKTDYRADFTIPLSRLNKFKTGFLYQNTDRTYNEKFFEYTTAGTFEGTADDYASNVGIARVDTSYYSHDGIVDTTVFWIFENTLSDASEDRNQYNGHKKITALYAMLEYSLTSRLNMIGGLRFEKTDLFSQTNDLSYQSGSIIENDYLPSLSFIYKTNTNMNFRASYGRTLARPTFREFTPAASEDFGISRIFTGNSELDRTLIDNYDLRWEWFMRPGEMFAVSTFYKNFTNPIELTIHDVNGNIQPRNSDEADLYGLEIEFRRNMSHIHPKLSNFSLGGNITVIKSSVKIDSAEVAQDVNVDNPQTIRPLEGQSPYVVNIDLGYNNRESGTTFSTYYNLFGRRLAFNAANGTPDVYEVPRHQLDVIASQRLFGGPKVKLSVKNILSQKSKFVHEDIGLQSQLDGVEYVYKEHSLGTSVSLGISYDIW